ncbi:MAG: hypothetical protein OHK0015_36040 [Chloroflexi bacterium OHK40]
MTRPNRQPARPTVIALRRSQSVVPVLFLLLALAVLAAGCGTAEPEGTAPPSADTAHAAWVQAVRAGDTAAAERLADPSLPDPAAFARDAVARMQDYLTNPASPTGPLENVSVEPVADGAGRSVWQFAEKRWCYSTQLVSREGGWFVSRWGQTSVGCQ